MNFSHEHHRRISHLNRLLIEFATTRSVFRTRKVGNLTIQPHEIENKRTLIAHFVFLEAGKLGFISSSIHRVR
jgi:hypothetical protein